MTFNIIFTTNTVRHLYLFTLSLLKHTSIQYRLVANACTADEIACLKALVGSNERLDLLIFPSNKLEDHHTVLNYLQKRETSKYFSFMDSDILATGDFVSELQTCLENHAAVFSGRMLFTEDICLHPDDPIIGGRFFETTDGFCIGSSYFAIYNNEALSDFIRKNNIDFSRFEWSKIPQEQKQTLVDIGLNRHFYDTGKLLNILLNVQSGKLVHVEPDSLHHIGGLSWFASRLSPDNKMHLQDILSGASSNNPAITKAMKSNPKRLMVAAYFIDTMNALFNGKPLPDIPSLKDERTHQRIRSVTNNLSELFREKREDMEQLLSLGT